MHIVMGEIAVTVESQNENTVPPQRLVRAQG
jgi:hypothetical protein